MVTLWYPSHFIGNIIGKFKEMPDEPSFIKSWKTYQTPDGEKGFKQYHLITVEQGRGDDAMVAIGNLLKGFWEIEGCHWKIEPLLGITDFSKMVK